MQSAECMALPTKLTEQQLETFRSAFNLYDMNGDGSIESKELYLVMKNLGVTIEEDELTDMLLEIGCKDRVQFQDFVQLMTFTGDNLEDTLRSSFSLFDSDHDGFIGISERK